jgi:Flp pilus assembly protein TadD
MNMGIIHFGRNDYQKALECLNKAESINPEDPEVIHQKGNCLAVAGKMKEAF